MKPVALPLQETKDLLFSSEINDPLHKANQASNVSRFFGFYAIGYTTTLSFFYFILRNCLIWTVYAEQLLITPRGSQMTSDVNLYVTG